jgi:hypothetical protein
MRLLSFFLLCSASVWALQAPSPALSSPTTPGLATGPQVPELPDSLGLKLRIDMLQNQKPQANAEMMLYLRHQTLRLEITGPMGIRVAAGRLDHWPRSSKQNCVLQSAQAPDSLLVSNALAASTCPDSAAPTSSPLWEIWIPDQELVFTGTSTQLPLGIESDAPKVDLVTALPLLWWGLDSQSVTNPNITSSLKLGPLKPCSSRLCPQWIETAPGPKGLRLTLVERQNKPQWKEKLWKWHPPEQLIRVQTDSIKKRGPIFLQGARH